MTSTQKTVLKRQGSLVFLMVLLSAGMFLALNAVTIEEAFEDGGHNTAELVRYHSEQQVYGDEPWAEIQFGTDHDSAAIIIPYDADIKRMVTVWYDSAGLDVFEATFDEEGRQIRPQYKGTSLYTADEAKIDDIYWLGSWSRYYIYTVNGITSVTYIRDGDKGYAMINGKIYAVYDYKTSEFTQGSGGRNPEYYRYLVKWEFEEMDIPAVK